MATIKIDERGVATITMANGKVIPVLPNWNGMELDSGASPYLITWAKGGEWWITSLDNLSIDGCGADLADGETITDSDGSTWTRHGDEMVVVSPAATEQRLAA